MDRAEFKSRHLAADRANVPIAELKAINARYSSDPYVDMMQHEINVWKCVAFLLLEQRGGQASICKVAMHDLSGRFIEMKSNERNRTYDLRIVDR